ncbi:hypothetical protein ACLKA7_001003 [Drosophila subpalustris]
MENDDYQPLLRRRRNRYLKWTESQVLEFLELVLDLVKDVPESLEKPTAQKFYAKERCSPNPFDLLTLRAQTRRSQHTVNYDVEGSLLSTPLLYLLASRQPGLPGKSTICDWYSNFKRGRSSTEDSKRSGRPKEVIIPEIIRQVRQIVLTDRRVKVREIAETVGISTGSAVSILHDHLHMKKLNVQWVPHFLDIEQREKRVADSKSCLDMFNRNPSEFLRRYITMDETWIHHYIPESNRSSAE